MADEITIRVGVFITKQTTAGLRYLHDDQQYEFRRDMNGSKGPSPGALTASPGGVIVDLSQLTIPGVCWIKSFDTDTGNYIEVCIYDPQTDKAYPFMEVRAGECWPIPLSRNLLEEYVSTGTGTTAASNQILVRSFNAPANCFIGAYED